MPPKFAKPTLAIAPRDEEESPHDAGGGGGMGGVAPGAGGGGGGDVMVRLWCNRAVPRSTLYRTAGDSAGKRLFRPGRPARARQGSLRLNNDGITVLTNSYDPYSFTSEGMSKSNGSCYKVSTAQAQGLARTSRRRWLIEAWLTPLTPADIRERHARHQAAGGGRQQHGARARMAHERVCAAPADHGRARKPTATQCTMPWSLCRRERSQRADAGPGRPARANVYLAPPTQHA